jgi:DNA adenine methylase
MLSNSDTPEIRKLYKGYRITQVKAARSINAKGKGRGAVAEVVIRNAFDSPK